jgi:hypothetical protein
MKRGYRALVHEKLSPGTGISRPTRSLSIVTLDSPAIEVMTDLEKEKAVTIGPMASIDTANRLMMASGVRLLLVTEPLDRVVGLITATDILGEKPMQVIGRAPGRTYSDVVVQHIMTPGEEIEVLAFDAVRTARVGDVVTRDLLGDSDRQTAGHARRHHASRKDLCRARSHPHGLIEQGEPLAAASLSPHSEARA